MAHRDFSFDSIDELFQAELLGDHSYVAPNLLSTNIDAIGPLVEYSFQLRHRQFQLPVVDNLPSTPSVHAMAAVRQVNSPMQSSLQPRDVEFVPIAEAASNPFSDLRWIAYQKRFEGACRLSGFSQTLARAITAAFGEMADNVVRHSERVGSATTGYRWSAGCFEYVVADAGIGVLASLRTCPDYAAIDDHAVALQTALQPNQTRFGRASGYGSGFSCVLTSLVNLQGSLRFRTGDQVLLLDGQSPDLASARVRQCPPFFQGFLVSVVCRPANFS